MSKKQAITIKKDESVPERKGNYLSLAEKKEAERKSQEEKEIEKARKEGYSAGYREGFSLGRCDSTSENNRDDDYSRWKEYQ